MIDYQAAILLYVSLENEHNTCSEAYTYMTLCSQISAGHVILKSTKTS